MIPGTTSSKNRYYYEYVLLVSWKEGLLRSQATLPPFFFQNIFFFIFYPRL